MSFFSEHGLCTLEKLNGHAPRIAQHGEYITSGRGTHVAIRCCTGSDKPAVHCCNVIDHEGETVTLKLKTARFRQLTRSRRLADPTRLAEEIYRAARHALESEADGRRFRLIGVGVSDLDDDALADPPDLADPDRGRRARIEQAIDAVRAKLGVQAIDKGRSLSAKRPGVRK